MIDVTAKLVYVGNRELIDSPLYTCSESHISAIDRFTDTVVFRSADLPISKENFIAVSLHGTVVTGSVGKLPADILTHLALYRKYPQISAIAHVYPPYTAAFAQVGKEIPVLGTYHAKLFKDAIPCVLTDAEDKSHDSSGSVRVNSVLHSLENAEVYSSGALLLQYDGALVWHETPLKAIRLAEDLEAIAHCAWNTILLSGGAFCAIPPVTTASRFMDNSVEPKDVPLCGPIGSRVTEKQKQSINLALLSHFDAVCRQNGIRYSLAGGTLLGAIRHGGFIPWDDDVDVFLPRPEYNKLSDVFPDGERYQFVTLQKDPSFNYVYGRLIDTWTLITDSPNTAGAGRGLYLDVCVVDGLPAKRWKRKLHISYMRLLVILRMSVVHDPKLKPSKKPFFNLIKRILYRTTDIHFWNRRLANAMARYPYESSPYVGNFTSKYGAREMLHASVFDKYHDVKFENLTCLICDGYEEYLNSIYGDYLSFPPEQKRSAPHITNAVWIKGGNGNGRS